MKKKNVQWLFLFCCLLAVSCNNPSEVDPALTNEDWTTESHSNDVLPDYSVVFPQDKVNTLEITMTSADWTAIQSDMAAKSWGTFGKGNSGGQPGQGNGGAGGGGGGNFGEDPDYVAVTLKFNGKTWNKVGFRLKGNSSLSSIWKSGIYKLPFRLNMDKYEDDYPEINNQRLYGFKELSMSPGYSDNTLLREKVVADIFRAGGVAAAQTAFYKVYIDFGSGSKYCGVYTMVEVIDDSMIKTQFGDDKGNIYKPESYLSGFSTDDFEKKNNKTVADFSDVQSFVTALNSSLRQTNASQWRTNLEAVFNVDQYLHYLAINNTIVNWDCYGAMAHNYYLYNSPAEKLTWIPWDFNMSMTSSGGGNGGTQAAVTLGMTEVTNKWPLLRYIASDPVYYATYKSYVKDFAENVFIPTQLNATLDQYHNLIAPYVTGSEPEQTGYSNLSSATAFTSDLTTLKNHIVTRNQAALTFSR